MAGWLPRAQTRAKAASYVVVPSVVFTASAWLSPGSGASGLLKGKTHAWSASPPWGVSTRASSGCARLGSGCVVSHTAVTVRGVAVVVVAVWFIKGADRAAYPPKTSVTRPRMPGVIGCHVFSSGHQAQASPPTSDTATSPASARRPGRPLVRLQTDVVARRSVRTRPAPPPGAPGKEEGGGEGGAARPPPAHPRGGPTPPRRRPPRSSSAGL